MSMLKSFMLQSKSVVQHKYLSNYGQSRYHHGPMKTLFFVPTSWMELAETSERLLLTAQEHIRPRHKTL
jgi:hypothetical protein